MLLYDIASLFSTKMTFLASVCLSLSFLDQIMKVESLLNVRTFIFLIKGILTFFNIVCFNALHHFFSKSYVNPSMCLYIFVMFDVIVKVNMS